MNNERKNELAVTNTSTNEIVLYQPNETIQLEVRLQDETVWLNQQQIAVLFGTQRQAITKHLKNIFESGELERQATCSILELVQKEGNRMVRRNVEIYNLDVIISVGYRVNTKRGIQFRQCIPIIFGTTFGTIFGTRKLFSKKYTHAETPVIQMLPRVVCPILLSTFSNLRHKTPSAPKIFAALL